MSATVAICDSCVSVVSEGVHGLVATGVTFGALGVISCFLGIAFNLQICHLFL